MLERLLSDFDLEQLKITSRSKAQKDRVAGRGIPFIKIGRLVRYRPADVEKYISDLPTLRSTSEADAVVAQAGIERPAIAKAEPASGPAGAAASPKSGLRRRRRPTESRLHDNSSGPERAMRIARGGAA
jgi:hypothetical protein